MATWAWLVVKDTRGSIFLSGLILVLIMTILGLALFDLGVQESRLVVGTDCDNQAFETAEAGLERARHLLYLDYCGDATCENPPTEPSWADGILKPDGTIFSATTATAPFADFIGTNNGIPDDPSFAGGTYFVQLKNLTGKDAGDLSLPCDAPNDGAPCTDRIYVRSTGNATVGVTSCTRTIQIIASARNLSSFGSGVIAGGCGLFSGNALIAGHFHIPRCSTEPCLVLQRSFN